jgi:hypothetical protein
MIRGTVDALDLVQLLQLIHNCGVSGELLVDDGERQHRLWFDNGELLRSGSAVDAEGTEEALYELLFVERGAYIFSHRPANTDPGSRLNTTAILVEASRRKDEYQRVNTLMPSLKSILLPAGKESLSRIKEKLAPMKLRAEPIFGKDSVEEVVERCGQRFQLLCEIAGLIEEGSLRPMPTAEVERQLKARLSGAPRRSAYRLYEWMHEVAELAQRAESWDATLLRRPWLELGTKPFRTPGPRALHILSRLLRYKESFEFTVRGNDAALCVSVHDDLLEVHSRGEINAPGIVARLVEKGIVGDSEMGRAEELAARFDCEPEDLLVDQGFVEPKVWLGLRLEQILDTAFSIFTWRRPLVTLRPKPTEAQTFIDDPFSTSLVLPLDQDLRHQLRLGLLKWKLFQQVIPSMDAIFICAQPSATGARRRAHDRLDGRRRVSDLLAMARVTGQELLQFIYNGVKTGKIRALSADEHRERIRRSGEKRRSTDVMMVYRSALSFGHESATGDRNLQPFIDDARLEEAKQPGAVAVLEGRFEKFNLAALIQLLKAGGVEGTLRVWAPEVGERILHIVEGGLYILFNTQSKGESATPNEFLTESTEDLLITLKRAMSGSNPEEIERLRQRLTEDVLEALLWDDAQFEFARNFIPSEFYARDEGNSKIRLPEDRLIFQAMQRLAEWDDLRAALKSDRAIFQFVSPQAKLDAYSEYGEFIYFIDGQRSLSELAKVADMPRLELYRALALMVEKQVIQYKDLSGRPRALGSESERVRWDLEL